MPRLIDANALIDGMKKRCNSLIKEYGSLDHYADGFAEAINYVENAPAVDAVEVVRCKDCKYYELHKCHNNANGWFSHRMSDDFCSYGERRTNGQD